MIRDDKDLKVLVANFEGIENERDPERTLQTCSVIRIPTCSIVRNVALNEQGGQATVFLLDRRGLILTGRFVLRQKGGRHPPELPV